MRYGAEGYAIYWYCLELIAGDLGEASEINFELKHDAEVIGFNLKIDQMRVQEIMTYMVSIDLFGQANGVVSCIKLAKYLDKKSTRNEYIHNIIDQVKTGTDGHENVADKLRTVPDKQLFVADKNGQIVTFPARVDKSRLDKNINTIVVGNDEPIPSDHPQSTPDCPHQEIISLFAKHLPMGIQPRAWTEARSATLKARWREDEERQSLAWWDRFFAYAAKSNFLTGKVSSKDRKPFEISLPWILKEETFNKIIEGFYH
jgi:hypothetical protein